MFGEHDRARRVQEERQRILADPACPAYIKRAMLGQKVEPKERPPHRKKPIDPELVARLIAARASATKIARAQGRHTNGQPPYGYKRVAGTLAIYEPEARVVRELYKRCLSRRGPPKFRGFYAARAWIRASGILTRSGKQWSNAAISNVFRNPVYAGCLPGRGPLVRAAHQPIVSLRRFRKVGLILSSSKRPLVFKSRKDKT